MTSATLQKHKMRCSTGKLEKKLSIQKLSKEMAPKITKLESTGKIMKNVQDRSKEQLGHPTGGNGSQTSCCSQFLDFHLSSHRYSSKSWKVKKLKVYLKGERSIRILHSK